MPAPPSLLTRPHSDSVLFAPLTTEAAILRALLYADIFDYALTLDELHRYTADLAALDDIRVTLESDWLADRVECHGSFVTLVGRGQLAELRLTREVYVTPLWERALWWGTLVACLPFVRMVAVTGALAMNNSASPHDDIDFLIVTIPGRVWLARAAAIAVVYTAKVFGVQLCPNFILDSDSLLQTRRDLFVAHELAQMIPLSGREWYWQMRQANNWSHDLLPNAKSLPRPIANYKPQSLGRLIQKTLEWGLSGWFGDALERWECERKLQKFRPQLEQQGSAAIIDAQQVKGHFNDYGQRALADYESRCREHGIAPWP